MWKTFGLLAVVLVAYFISLSYGGIRLALAGRVVRDGIRVRRLGDVYL